MNLPQTLIDISRHLSVIGAKAIVVGGSVRDHYLGLQCKDYDVEVYGLRSMQELHDALKEHGDINLVGKSFGVLKFTQDGEEYDFSFPRTESNTGVGHRDFDINTDGFMSYKQASKRRDFTINSMGYDIQSCTFVDPHGGLLDLEQKILRHIDDETFVEDPLRVYRAIQLASRFGFELDLATAKLCRQMVQDDMLEALPKERIYEELKKLLLKSPAPSVGFEMMRELDVLRHYPELKAIVKVQQSPKWHPEGDVWIHTMMALDAMRAELNAESVDKKYQIMFLLAILCHDLGKATNTTVDDDGTIHSYGHEFAGIKPTESLLESFGVEHNIIKSILPLVEHHLKPSQFYRAKSSDKAIRKLATKVNISQLVVVAKADSLGRTTADALAGKYPPKEWLLQKAEVLNVKDRKLENIIQGRDLMELGFKPSEYFGKIIEDVYQKQLDGELSTKTEALEYVKNHFS